MARQQSPAFQFYPKDFLTSERVIGMTYEQRGIYITLLSQCWLEGSITASIDELAEQLRIRKRKAQGILHRVLGGFKERNGRLFHPRLEEERRKQREFREKQRLKGEASAAAKRLHRGSTVVQPMAVGSRLQPEANSSISNLQSPISSLQTDPTARSKRPIFTGQRFTVFEWQLDDLCRMLGRHTEAFDLHAWFFDLDAQAAKTDQVIPVRDGGKWLQAQTLAEAKRRGLPIDDGKPKRETDEEFAAGVLEEIRRQDAAVRR